ncbi:MAG TPA: metalloregulator ArsR/SmtB family transcription factor [Chloroflexota bacterium]
MKLASPPVGQVDSRRVASADQLRVFKAELFKALAHPSRIKILDLLRDQSRTVSELQAQLGIEPSSVSQQLAVLRAKHLVDGRREGISVYYSVRDPQIFTLLDAARTIFDNHLVTLRAMAGEDTALSGAAG